MPKLSEEYERGYSTDLGLEEDTSMRLSMDRFWCSDGVKKKIAANLVSKIQGNTSCFSRIDTKPLYRKGTRGYYRVTIYARDYLQDGFMTTSRILRSYYVEVEGVDCRICSTSPQINKI